MSTEPAMHAPLRGRLVSGITRRQGGRKIDTWRFAPGGGDVYEEHNGKIVFELFMGDGMDMTVRTCDIPPERWTDLHGYDLRRLHDEALSAARAEFDLKSKLEWSSWLEVMVSEADKGELRNTINSVKAGLSYRQIPCAIAPDGTRYTVNDDGITRKFPEAVLIYQDKDGESFGLRGNIKTGAIDSRDAKTQFTYLPDTPEARAGLDNIAAAIDKVNQRLQDFLLPEQIQHTLQQVVSGTSALLLEPPKDSGEVNRVVMRKAVP